MTTAIHFDLSQKAEKRSEDHALNFSVTSCVYATHHVIFDNYQQLANIATPMSSFLFCVCWQLAYIIEQSMMAMSTKLNEPVITLQCKLALSLSHQVNNTVQIYLTTCTHIQFVPMLVRKKENRALNTSSSLYGLGL